MKLNVTSAGAGTPILFIHGCASDGTFFREAAHCLADAFQVILYDRRGYGESDPAEDGDYSAEAQARDAVTALDRFADGCPAWIVAHSGGCFPALEAAMRFPSRLKGLLLAEAPVPYSAEVRAELDEWFGKMDQYRGRRSVASALRAFAQASPDRPKTEKDSSLERIYSGMKNMRSFLEGEFDAVRAYRPEQDRLKAISVPAAVLISEGGREHLFGRACAEMGEVCRWPVYTMPGFHNSPSDHPEHFAALIRNILHDLSGIS